MLEAVREEEVGGRREGEGGGAGGGGGGGGHGTYCTLHNRKNERDETVTLFHLDLDSIKTLSFH